MFKRIIVCVFANLALILFQASGSFAHESEEVCVSETYYCVADYSSYRGEDPYNLYLFNQEVSPFHGTRHSCTSFVAWMLAKNNQWMPEISTFDSAYAWDTEAVSRVWAEIVAVPKVGDIAQWETISAPKMGHVGYVSAVKLSSTGSVTSIDVIDDNGGRYVTTRKVLYPESTQGTISWPDHFIRFPQKPRITPGGGFIDRSALSIGINPW
jgi:hypothetical protein